jgi:hypothetical protein
MKCTKEFIAGVTFTLLCMSVSQAAVIKMIDDGIATDATNGGDARMKRLTSNYHMTANNEYHLDGIVIVASGVTLTIDPGTVIRGWNVSETAIANRPGCLIIARGAKIYANGTAQKPIIFTDRWDNNVPGQTAGVVSRTWTYRASGTTDKVLTNHAYDYSKLGTHHGYWGGLVVCGNAFVSWNKSGAGNIGALGQSTAYVEGVGSGAGVYGGGNNDDDSSGVIKYVVIRYGGYTLVDGGEINGLTLYGVGRGTELHHVEVYNNQDDGIEWFGGTVNGKYLVVWGAGDDTFDSDTGFRGKNQFLFGVQQNLGGTKFESGVADKGMEMDGAESAPSSSPSTTGSQEPFSASSWYNVTIIGWDSTSTASSIARNGAVVMRDNASAHIKNSLFLNFGVFGGMIENVTGRGNYHSNYRFLTSNISTNMPSTTASYINGATVDRQYLYQGQQPGKQACLQDSVFYINGIACPVIADMGGSTSAPNMADGSKGPIFTGGDNFDFMAAAFNNVDLTPGVDTLPIKSLTTKAYAGSNAWGSASIATTVGANTYVGNNPSVIDPRAAGAALTATQAVPSDGVLTAVTYRGAFDADSNWAQGWTTIAKLGAFGTYTAVPEDVTVVTNVVTSVVTNGVNGIVYQTAALMTTGTGVAANALQTSPVLTYTLASAGTYQLQSTPSLEGTPTWSVVKTFTAAGPVTVNLTDILTQNPSPSMFYQLVKQP